MKLFSLLLILHPLFWFQVLSISLAALGSLMWLRKNKPKTLIPIIYACAIIVATMPSITRHVPYPCHRVIQNGFCILHDLNMLWAFSPHTNLKVFRKSSFPFSLKILPWIHVTLSDFDDTFHKLTLLLAQKAIVPFVWLLFCSYMAQY